MRHVLAATLVALSGAAHAQGTALATISIDREIIVVALDLPGPAALGYDHMPQTEADRLAIEDAFARLRAPDALFAFPPAAGCVPGPAMVELDIAGSGPPAFTADYAYQCLDTAAVDRIDFPILSAFERLGALDLDTRSLTGAETTTITPDTPRHTFAR